MNVPTPGFFSRTARRVMLPRTLHEDHDAPDSALDSGAGLTIDHALDSASRRSRVVAYRDDDTDCVALVVGDAVGADDVPVHTVPEERLILEAGRSHEPVEIFVGVPDGSDVRVQQRELDRQLCTGGPLRSMLACSGARSIVVDWYPPARQGSAPDARPLIRARP